MRAIGCKPPALRRWPASGEGPDVNSLMARQFRTDSLTLLASHTYNDVIGSMPARAGVTGRTDPCAS
jgi:hypothetical protein